MANEQGTKGLRERSANFLEKLNYGLGAIALVGAVVFPEFATQLVILGALQIAEGVFWGAFKTGRRPKKPQLAPA